MRTLLILLLALIYLMSVSQLYLGAGYLFIFPALASIYVFYKELN